MNLQVIEPDQYSIDYTWNSLDLDSSDDVLVLLPYEEYLVKDYIMTLDYLSWGGRRGKLITIEYVGEEDHNEFGFFVSALPDSSNRIILSPLESVYLSEIYLLSVGEENIIGFDPGCNSKLSYARDIALGTNYLAYRCDESRHLLNLVELEEPFSIITINLMGLIEDILHYEPKWVNDSTLVLEDLFHRGLCIVNTPGWLLSCYDYPFWIGNISPNDNLVEVRADRYYMHPSKLGVLQRECLSLPETCDPILRPGWIPSEGDYILDDAAWLDNSEGLLYTVHIHTDRTTMEPDATEFWLLDIGSMEVERIGRYDRMLSFSMIKPSPFPKLWSPNGEWIVVTDGMNQYLLSIETGELEFFTEGRYVLGPLDLTRGASE